MKKELLLITIVFFFICSFGDVNAALTNTTLLNDSFEAITVNWTTDWDIVTDEYTSAPSSIQASRTDNDLISKDLDTSDATKLFVSFSYRVDDIDGNDNVQVYYYDGTAYDLIDEIGDDAEDTWLSFSDTVTDSQYFKSNFKIYFEGSSIDINENLWVDDLTIIKEADVNTAPVINNMSSSHSIIKGGNTITFSANTSLNGVNDTDTDTLFLYCDASLLPTAANTDCTGGITTDTTYPYGLTCTFTTSITDINYTEYCRVYDGSDYSPVVNVSYLTDSTTPITSVISVAGDTAASYFDTVDDSLTEINISGETSMACRWSNSDISYGSMTNDCTISGTDASCSINNVGSQGYHTRYISCQDQYENSQNSTQNLDISFYLDYTSPTTSDNSNINIQAPPYEVTITEQDNVDSDPTSYYCTDTSNSCNPLTIIDDGGIITFTNLNRGINYLRYYSLDDAGNIQNIINKTVNINQLPVFTSASDDATTIKGGTTINITTVSSESDSQQLTLYVCDSSSATFNGCDDNEYCSTTGNENLSCIFSAENDSSTHTWYAFIFDDSDEAASTNPIAGSYTTDSTNPTIAIVSPTNGSTITQDSVTFTVLGNENLNWAAYSINNGANITMNNVSGIQWSLTNNSIADGAYNVTFYGNDTYGNLGTAGTIIFTIDTTVPDTTAPTITIHSPINGTYYTVVSTLLNITANENLSWAGYTLNGGSLIDLSSTSPTNWNKTINLPEGYNNITFYANDTSNNQESKEISIYTDLTNPAVNLTCNTSVTTSQNITCVGNFSDTISLDYAIFSHNATGIWANSSQLSLSGNIDTLTRNIYATNTTPPKFSAKFYVFDSSGRTNSNTTTINVTDDVFPIISNISYVPNNTLDLDPGVQINVSATIIEDYNISAVYLMYKNESATLWDFAQMTNTTATRYNASFTPQNGTWQFKINASDSAGNINISNITELTVTNDISANISTDINQIESFTLAQASDNNSLGNLLLNNTGDTSLIFNVSFSSSSIGDRLFVNGTNSNNGSFSINSGITGNITIEANTTALPAGLYNYTIITKSQAGTNSLSKQLNIQTASGAYLDVTITEYDPTVDSGDEGIEYIAKVENLGTADAQNINLTWVLPSQFSLTSGELSRNFATLAIGASATNSITVSVLGEEANTNITANAIADGNLSASDFKAITIGTPATVTTTSSGGGGGAGGGGTAGATAIEYERIIEIVRGEKDSFPIEIENTYSGILENVELSMMGFPYQYIKLSPDIINSIPPNWSSNFTAEVEVPIYETESEYDLRVVIKGWIIYSQDRKSSYKQTQYIKLIVQEISREDAESVLEKAREAINQMKEANFNILEVNSLLEEGENKLNERKNKQAYDVANQIIEIRNTAFRTNNLINILIEALKNPGRTNLLTGDITKEFSTDYGSYNLQDILIGNVAFSSDSTRDLLALAVAAFERGDYLTAEERLNEARVLLLLERKGNIGLFLYLYWHYLVIGLLILTISGIVGYRRYQKSSITRRIDNINEEEQNIKKLLIENQRNYFAAKISDTEFHRIESQHHKRLTKLKKIRSKLRNRRIKTLKPREAIRDIDIENLQIDHAIKELQTKFYKKGKITEKEYKLEFNMLNERLAELEGERTTFALMKGNITEKEKVSKKPKKIKKKNVKKK